MSTACDTRRRRRCAPRASPTASSPPPAPTSIAARGSTRPAGEVLLAEYSARWLADRPNLRPRSQELYRGVLRLHVLPTLGATELAAITPAKARSWRAGLINAGHPGASTIFQAYRLLHAICATALEDGLIARNPCVIKGASVERPAERPVATIEQVYAIADAIEPRYQAMVLLATFCGLRVGELRALRQRNLDLLHRTVSVVEQYQQLGDGRSSGATEDRRRPFRSATLHAVATSIARGGDQRAARAHRDVEIRRLSERRFRRVHQSS